MGKRAKYGQSTISAWRRLTVEYIGWAGLLENYNSPPYSSLDRNWRNTTSFPLRPADSEIRRAVPKFFDGLISIRVLLVPLPLTTPSTALGKRALMSPNPLESL